MRYRPTAEQDFLGAVVALGQVDLVRPAGQFLIDDLDDVAHPSDVALVLDLADGFQRGLDFSPAAGAKSGVRSSTIIQSGAKVAMACGAVARQRAEDHLWRLFFASTPARAPRMQPPGRDYWREERTLWPARSIRCACKSDRGWRSHRCPELSSNGRRHFVPRVHLWPRLLSIPGSPMGAAVAHLWEPLRGLIYRGENRSRAMSHWSRSNGDAGRRAEIGPAHPR
jgi:hypothetical protein